MSLRKMSWLWSLSTIARFSWQCWTPPSEALRFIHVSPPNAVLEIVDELPRNTRTCALFEQSEARGMLAFRVRYWKHSAIANAVPVFTPESRHPMAVSHG